MEENNFSNQNPQQNSNEYYYNQVKQHSLPNSVAALVLGIISIFFSLIWCYWIGSTISLICGIIGLVLAKNGKNLLISNTNIYSQSSINNNNAGWIMSIIGISIASLELVVLIIVIVFFKTVTDSFQSLPH